MGKKPDEKPTAEPELAGKRIKDLETHIGMLEANLETDHKRIEDHEKDVGTLQADLDRSDLQLINALKRIEDLAGDLDNLEAAGPMGRPPSADELLDLLVEKAGTAPLEVLRFLTEELKGRKAAPAAPVVDSAKTEKDRLAAQQLTREKWLKARDERRLLQKRMG